MPFVSGGGPSLPVPFVVQNLGAVADTATFADEFGNSLLEIQPHGGVYVASATAAEAALFVDATNAGQTADMVQIWSPADAAIKAGFNKGAYWYTKKNAAPADGDLAAGQLMLWFDQTNGASKLMVKAKQADGTVKTASIALA